MRFGLIGAGGMGRYHADSLSRVAEASIVAIGEPVVVGPVSSLAEHLGADLLPSAEAVLARDDVDAVIVATPTSAHAEVAIAAARAGKHIFCEKPLARTLQEGEAMLEAAAAAGVKLAAGQVVRYFPDYAAARDMVLRGDIGQPGVARATRGTLLLAHSWYADFERSGGVALDIMIHDLDWMRWTFGPVERLHAHGLTYAGMPGRDAAMAVLRFRSGVLGYVEGSWASPGGFCTSLEVSGSGGLIRTDNRSSATLLFEMFPDEHGDRPALYAGSGFTESPYTLQLRDAIGWFAGGEPPRCTGEDAFESLRLALSVLESMHTGRPVVFAGGMP